MNQTISNLLFSYVCKRTVALTLNQDSHRRAESDSDIKVYRTSFVLNSEPRGGDVCNKGNSTGNNEPGRKDTQTPHVLNSDTCADNCG